MSLVKKILMATGLSILALFAVCRYEAPQANPVGPVAQAASRIPARADLAEAVFAMVLENAAASGKPLSQPVTLCEACAAAHLGLPDATVRERCRRACGLP